MSNSPPAETAELRPVTVASIVGKTAYALENTLPTGDVAELRRLDPHAPSCAAFWKLLLACVPDGWTAGSQSTEKERQWGALFAGMAHSVGLHSPGVPLGRALAEAGWSELRFVRLLRDRGDSLADRIRRLAQYLKSKAQPANWIDVAELLLNQDGEWAERHRRRIARDYYSALHAIENSH